MSFPLLSNVFEAFERRILGSEMQQHFQANGVTVFKESTKDRACLFILERGINPQLFLLSRQGPTFEIAVFVGRPKTSGKWESAQAFLLGYLHGAMFNHSEVEDFPFNVQILEGTYLSNSDRLPFLPEGLWAVLTGSLIDADQDEWDLDTFSGSVDEFADIIKFGMESLRIGVGDWDKSFAEHIDLSFPRPNPRDIPTYPDYFDSRFQEEEVTYEIQREGMGIVMDPVVIRNGESATIEEISDEIYEDYQRDIFGQLDEESDESD